MFCFSHHVPLMSCKVQKGYHLHSHFHLQIQYQIGEASSLLNPPIKHCPVESPFNSTGAQYHFVGKTKYVPWMNVSEGGRTISITITNDIKSGHMDGKSYMRVDNGSGTVNFVINSAQTTCENDVLKKSELKPVTVRPTKSSI